MEAPSAPGLSFDVLPLRHRSTSKTHLVICSTPASSHKVSTYPCMHHFSAISVSSSTLPSQCSEAGCPHLQSVACFPFFSPGTFEQDTCSRLAHFACQVRAHATAADHDDARFHRHRQCRCTCVHLDRIARRTCGSPRTRTTRSKDRKSTVRTRSTDGLSKSLKRDRPLDPRTVHRRKGAVEREDGRLDWEEVPSERGRGRVEFGRFMRERFACWSERFDWRESTAASNRSDAPLESVLQGESHLRRSPKRRVGQSTPQAGKGGIRSLWTNPSKPSEAEFGTRRRIRTTAATQRQRKHGTGHTFED